MSLWGVVKAAVADPRTLIGLVAPQFWLPLVSPVTLLLFLVALYQELTGHASPSRRQVWAFAAAAGMAVRIGLRVWQLHAGAVALTSLPPQVRAQFSAAAFDFRGQWVQALLRNIIPAIIWIGFLLVFWRDVAPLGRKWTRGLAFVLCLVTTTQVVNEIGRTFSDTHRYLAGWPGRAVALLGTQGQTQDRNAALTLAVRLIAPCDSARAGAPMQLSGTAKNYCLNEPAIVDQRDIAWAEFDQNAYDKSSIRITLNDDAARRFNENLGLEVGVVLNGRLVSVSRLLAPTGQVWIAGLARNVAAKVVETFQRRRPVFTYWNLVILPAWSLVLRLVLLAASAALPYFLFSVCRSSSASEPAQGATTL